MNLRFSAVATLWTLATIQWALLGALVGGRGRQHVAGVLVRHLNIQVPFAKVDLWAQSLTAAQRVGKLDLERERRGRTRLLIVDAVGYVPAEPEAAALLLALIAFRYERASAMVSTNIIVSA